jgi:hypothetical protein
MPALALLLLLGSAVATPRYAAFGRYRTWAVVNLTNGQSEWLTLPQDVRPRELTIADDGRLIVFTAYAAEAGTFLLYSWDKDASHPPRLVGDTRGYHANPAFDRAGEWIYFAHNPNAVGMPMGHMARAYAQIYRVRSDGTDLQPLTAEDGCHFSPVANKTGGVVFVHTQCHGHDRDLVSRTSASGSETTMKLAGDAAELALSEDGKRTIYVVRRKRSAFLFEMDVTTGVSKPIDSGTSDAAVAPRFGKGRESYYVLDDVVWRQHGASKIRVVSLKEGPQ